MIELLAGSSIALVLIWFSAPRFFHLFDVSEMQRRLHSDDFIREVAKSSHPSSGQQHRENSAVLDFSTFCESLARATRSGTAPHDALLTSLQRHPFQHPCWLVLLDDVTAMRSCESALATARESAQPDSNDAQCISLLQSAMVHGNFVPSALDHGSSVLRDHAACNAELAVAASQAQLSAQLLSALPFLLLVVQFWLALNSVHHCGHPLFCVRCLSVWC